MRTSLFNYDLPKELIAHKPARERDNSRLMVLNRETGQVFCHKFYELADILGQGDVLVFNESKVFPARLVGKKDSGGRLEILLLGQTDFSGVWWKAMHRGKAEAGMKIGFGKVKAEICRVDNEFIELKFECSKTEFDEMIDEVGQTPIPPYIHSLDNESELREKYQTVYAKTIGSVAAPTAGLHFSQKLIDKLEVQGVEMCFVTLHVGLGTFAPVKSESLEEHKMHEEYYSVSEEASCKLNNAKEDGKRIIAVGTTTTRVLESLAGDDGTILFGSGSTDIFIYPGYKFKFIDGLITNFHLPKSTLLALVSAFVSDPNTTAPFRSFGESFVGKAYRTAIEDKYRFYSFGDAMLII